MIIKQSNKLKKKISPRSFAICVSAYTRRYCLLLNFSHMLQNDRIQTEKIWKFKVQLNANTALLIFWSMAYLVNHSILTFQTTNIHNSWYHNGDIITYKLGAFKINSARYVVISQYTQEWGLYVLRYIQTNSSIYEYLNFIK